MPEGDSLVRLAQRLRPVVVGEQLSSSDFRLPQLATVSLAGARISAVTTRGKWLLMHLDREVDQFVLLSHLGMDGSWRIKHTGRDAAPNIRVVLNFLTCRLVGVSLKEVHLLSPEQTEHRLAHLGPDLLDPQWGQQHRDTALDRVRAAPERPIGAALLDQRNVAGIGNIYRCEVLLLAGIDPHTPVGQVADLPAVLELARQLMRVNTLQNPLQNGPRRSPHSSPKRGSRTTTGVTSDPSAPFGVRVLDPTDLTDPAVRRLAARGTAAYWVYGRERAGCLRCGGPVRRETGQASAISQTSATHQTSAISRPGESSAERVLYWCPRCQR